MDTWKCQNCQQDAVIICNCQDKPIYLCENHQFPHQLKFPYLKHTFELLYLQINNLTKQLLIERIIRLKGESINIINKTIEFQSAIMNKSKGIISEMITFIKICNDYLTEISRTDKIIKKDYYTQLEAILLGQNQEIFIDSLSFPLINLPDAF